MLFFYVFYLDFSKNCPQPLSKQKAVLPKPKHKNRLMMPPKIDEDKATW